MRKTEETLVLLKPDAVERGLCGEILARFERAGLRIRDVCRSRFTRARFAEHYAELRAQHPKAFARNARSLIGRDVFAVILGGPNAIAKVRALMGPTDPLAAPAGTIRGDFSADSIALADAEDRTLSNLVHAADSPASARREVRIWFGGF